ncbi:MAG: DEAD/DEAH box helicase [Candidatus Lokiarchaeota archaeon]|nr:DEAD/DEAH box helicase [Candidatus Lokiarchaeota archaeon]
MVANWCISISHVHIFVIERRRLEVDKSNYWPFPHIKKYIVSNKDFMPYKLQSQAWEVIKNGDSLLLYSGTGSGKTLALILPMMELIKVKDKRNCLIIYPIKALSQDQEKKLRKIGGKLDLVIQRLDASVKEEARKKIKKKPGDILITTPEFIFGSLIGTKKNKNWIKYLINTSMIWVDEFHAMSGTLGTVICYFIRIISAINSSLRFYFTSATLPNAKGITPLLPHDPKVIEGGSQHGKIRFHIKPINEFDNILELMLRDSGQFIIFIENKAKIDEIFDNYDLSRRSVDRYHADLPDDMRHRIMDRFIQRELKGLLCTSAASLGLDIPSVKNIILVEFPRSFSLLFQEMGRGVRNPDADGNVFLLLNEERLIDNYYLNNPKKLEADIRGFKLEPMIIDLMNEKILQGMILFAITLGITDMKTLKNIFNEANEAGHLERTLTWLLVKGLVSKNKQLYEFKSDTALSYSKKHLIDFLFSLRPGFSNYKIKLQNDTTKNILGKISANKIPFKASIENYYTTDNRCYKIKNINKEKKELYVEEVLNSYRYESKNDVITTVSMIEELDSKAYNRFRLRYGRFKVRITPIIIRSTKKDNNTTIETLESTPDKFKNKCALEFNTKGVAMELTVRENNELNLSESILYQLSKIILRNAAIMINISENEVDCYQEPDRKTLYFLDRAGPTGLSKQLFEHFLNILKMTKRILLSCDCTENGCDRCCIPIESTYLMPNLRSNDTYRKNEMIKILEWSGA